MTVFVEQERGGVDESGDAVGLQEEEERGSGRGRGQSPAPAAEEEDEGDFDDDDLIASTSGVDTPVGSSLQQTGTAPSR